MTPLKDLTQKQKDILSFIYEEIKSNQLPPSIREIATRFGFASPRSVQDHLKALVKKGFIRITQNKSRAIEIIREHLFSIPLLGSVQAGMPTLAVENIDEYVNLDKLIFSDSKVFALRVKGDSMINAGVMPGDLVVVRQQAFAEVGQMIVALIEDEATIKNLIKKGREYFLEPANPNYDLIPLTGDATIIGVVLTVIRNLR
ncbi:MAG: repressor LexA [Candidatus Omnitrophica bacterium]|nr:repressor LexA [Candidatus Omnitrophota bacterium]